MGKPWVGVDFDGSLATYDTWKGPDHCGEPIKPMIKLVKDILELGLDVKIFTARVSHPEEGPIAKAAIEKWCEKHIGQKLEVTNIKDYDMVVLYDDRAISLEENTGRIIGSDQWNRILNHVEDLTK